MKKIKIPKKVKNTVNTIYIRSVDKNLKEKFYSICKDKQLRPNELFEELVKAISCT